MKRSRAPLVPFLAAVAAHGCTAPDVRVATWGTMREVLREGHAEGRVSPHEVATADTIGVGALADLAGEVTIVDGRALVATGAPGAPLRVRAATSADRAALLILANVTAWDEVAIGDLADYTALEDRIAAELTRRGIGLAAATPVRVRGRGTSVRVHVIAGACPIANPRGPAPWRFAGPVDELELVGVFADDAAGRLTHHDRRSHLHAVAPGLTGHLDDVALRSATLLLPVQ